MRIIQRIYLKARKKRVSNRRGALLTKTHYTPGYTINKIFDSQTRCLLKKTMYLKILIIEIKNAH